MCRGITSTVQPTMNSYSSLPLCSDEAHSIFNWILPLRPCFDSIYQMEKRGMLSSALGCCTVSLERSKLPWSSTHFKESTLTHFYSSRSHNCQSPSNECLPRNVTISPRVSNPQGVLANLQEKYIHEGLFQYSKAKKIGKASIALGCCMLMSTLSMNLMTKAILLRWSVKGK